MKLHQQARVLADPLRLRILRALAREPALTTRELADRLRMPPATLYRHLRLLRRAGFLARSGRLPARYSVQRQAMERFLGRLYALIQPPFRDPDEPYEDF